MDPTEKRHLSPAVFDVRIANPDDLPFIVEQESRPEFQGLLFDWPIERHREALTDTTKRYRVAADGHEKRLGFSILGNLEGKNPIVIRLVAAQEGVGVGSRLLADAIDYIFNQTNAPVLYLDVFPENTRAIALYERFGFREVIKLRRAATLNGVEKPLLVMALEKPF